MRYLFTLFFLVIALLANAQSTKGILLLRVFPVDAIVKIDGKKYVERDQNGFLKVELDSGMHFLQCWAPTHELIEDSFNINTNQTTKKSEYLTYSKDFRVFQKKSRGRTFIKTGLIILPSALLIGFTVDYFTKKPQLAENVETARIEVEETRDRYLIAASINSVNKATKDYQNALEIYNIEVEAYNDFAKDASIKITVSAVALGLSIWVSSKIKKPSFEEKTLLSRVNLIIDPCNLNGTLTYNLFNP